MTSSEIEEASASPSSGITAASKTTRTAQTASTPAVKTTRTKPPSLSGGHYIQPAVADWNLKLVNKWNPIDSNYAQSLFTWSGVNKFDSRAIGKLRALVSAGSKYNIRVASLYRSIEKQTELFNREVNRYIAQGKSRTEAEYLASALVARPGTSEHNLGLAADLLFGNYSTLETSYETTAAYSWMMAHCADYGFILRFPKNKQRVTGVTFEPWHYRYVGEEAAHEIMSRGLTLEEYLQEKGK